MAFLFLGCYDITCEEKRGKKKHEVFTKEWYEACQAADWCLYMAVSKNAEEFSEEYYKDLYTRRRRAFVKQMKEEEEQTK